MNDKLAWTGELRLLEAKWTDKDGHLVKFKIVSPNEERPNPFKAFTKRRGDRAGTRFHAVLQHVKGVTTDDSAYNGQLMLCAWGDTSSQGYTVTFWCEHPEEGIHAFEGYARNVDSFMTVLVELDDAEQVIDQAKRARVEAAQKDERKGGELAKLAGMFSQQHTFWEWVKHVSGGTWDPTSAEDAAQYVRDLCKVSSRRLLDHDELAGKRFHQLIRQPYVAWQEQEGKGEAPW